jgi:hypothetical protein
LRHSFERSPSTPRQAHALRYQLPSAFLWVPVSPSMERIETIN